MPVSRVDMGLVPEADDPAFASPSLTAYHLPGRTEIDIVPARRWRAWMDSAEHRWPNRCLPLLVANESAWWLLNPFAFTAVWDGGNTDASVKVTLDGAARRDGLIGSMFGYGILTWVIPYLFRTDPGWNLLARGPANEPKHGISPLEGLVETDWSCVTFTMNWKLTQPDLPVRFEAGEPFCAIVPQRRYDLEAFAPRTTSLAEDADLERRFRNWEHSREKVSILKFVSRYGRVEGCDSRTWQKDYFKGRTVDGEPAADHQTTRGLRPFTESGSGPGLAG